MNFEIKIAVELHNPFVNSQHVICMSLWPMIIQGLLELLWMVYLEEKLQSCLKLRNFQSHFHKVKSVGL